MAETSRLTSVRRGATVLVVVLCLVVAAGTDADDAHALPAAATLLASRTAQPPNLVVNSTFEAGTAGWAGGPGTVLATTAGHRSGRSARLRADGAAPRTVVLNDEVNTVRSTVAGHTYRATAWVRTGHATAQVSVRMMEYTRAHRLLGTAQGTVRPGPVGWALVSTEYTAVSDGATLDLNVLARGVTGQQAVDVDDVSLTDVTASRLRPWRLVWADEFSGSAVDRERWTVLDGSTYGAANDELACQTARPENVHVSGGTLKITARREDRPLACEGGTTRAYSSGHLHTKTTQSFMYGRFEVRAKVPLRPGTSKGLWPAFWMRPATGSVGELDVMEQVGTARDEVARAGWVSQTLWYDYSGTYPKSDHVYRPTAVSTYEGFHTYAVEWEPGSVRWFVDGVLTEERLATDLPWLDTAFDRPFYLRLNLAVGGRWPGAPDSSTAFPATYEVDYVRVYQR